MKSDNLSIFFLRGPFPYAFFLSFILFLSLALALVPMERKKNHKQKKSSIVDLYSQFPYSFNLSLFLEVHSTIQLHSWFGYATLSFSFTHRDTQSHHILWYTFFFVVVVAAAVVSLALSQYWNWCFMDRLKMLICVSACANIAYILNSFRLVSKSWWFFIDLLAHRCFVVVNFSTQWMTSIELKSNDSNNNNKCRKEEDKRQKKMNQIQMDFSHRSFKPTHITIRCQFTCRKREAEFS